MVTYDFDTVYDKQPNVECHETSSLIWKVEKILCFLEILTGNFKLLFFSSGEIQIGSW